MYLVYILKFVLLGMLFMDAISVFESQQARQLNQQNASSVVAPVQASSALSQQVIRK